MKKNMRWRFLLLSLALLFVLVLTGSFFYLGAMDETREIAISSEELLPVKEEVREENGRLYYTKEYLLTGEDNPNHISRESFKDNGIRWEFLRLDDKKEIKELEKEYEHKVTFESSSNNMKTLLGMLPATKDITTEDGYQGTVYLDASSIQAVAKGYQTNTVPVQKTREYHHLSGQDLSLVPKSITEDGVTYRFKTVNWQMANTALLDGYLVPDQYMAVATYETDVRTVKATGYTVTAVYRGVVEKEAVEGIRYEAIFSGTECSFQEYVPVKIAGSLFILAFLGLAAVLLIRVLKEKRENRKTIEERW